MQALAQEALNRNEPTQIGLMCQCLEVSRAAYYKWLHRRPNQRELDNEEIYKYIKALEEKRHYIFGVKRLVAYVNKETPYHVSAGRIRRLMKKHNIRASILVAKHDRKAERKEYILGNKLLTADAKHDFHPDKPNQVWVTDCSELKYGIKGGSKIRVSAIKDLYDHHVVAWRIEPTETAALVTDTFSAAILATGGVKPDILHSDQGSSYTSGQYNKALAGAGVTHSMSRPGTPGDNSPMESLWSHMKTEYFDFEHPLSLEEITALVADFMDWYNNCKHLITDRL
ncbi:IS3 family transposase [Levilactobacillus parabrevis]|uniref:IS3 family transposase n=1 Tax=Levilactobacillus parabrevis TaxID=357278 RepID=UPI001ED9C61F|nr:IS3 family transposase [Levilactobacillus parabrevis]